MLEKEHKPSAGFSLETMRLPIWSGAVGHALSPGPGFRFYGHPSETTQQSGLGGHHDGTTFAHPGGGQVLGEHGLAQGWECERLHQDVDLVQGVAKTWSSTSLALDVCLTTYLEKIASRDMGFHRNFMPSKKKKTSSNWISIPKLFIQGSATIVQGPEQRKCWFWATPCEDVLYFLEHVIYPLV